MEREEIIYILGTKKGVGKTTVLNYLLRYWRDCCVASVGLDGEERDNLTNEPKPRVVVTRSHLVLTGEKFLSLSRFEVIDIYSHNPVAGYIVLARPLIETSVILAGTTSTVIQQVKIKHRLKKVIVDGALNRLTHAGVIDGAKIFLVVHDDGLESLKIVKKILFVSSLPKAPQHILDTFREKQGVWAITKDGKIEKISDSCLTLRNPDDNNLEWLYISGFATQTTLKMKDRLKICLVNPFAVAEVPDDFDNIYTANSVKLERIFINSSKCHGLSESIKWWLGNSVVKIEDVLSI